MGRSSGGVASKDKAAKVAIPLDHATTARLCLNEYMSKKCYQRLSNIGTHQNAWFTRHPNPPPLVIATPSLSEASTNNIVRRRECDIETTSE